MAGNLKLVKGVMINGKRLLISFSHLGRRYRITTIYEAVQVNVAKAATLLSTIKIDLNRGQFYIVNYVRKVTNPKALEHLDANFDEIQKQVLLIDLISDQISRYKNMFETGNISIGTYDCYNYAINKHLVSYFEKTKLNEFNLELLETFISQIKLGKKRINLILVPLKLIMRRVKKQGLININPFDELEPKSWQSQVTTTDYQVEPFSQNEISLILANTKHPTIQNLIQTGFWTGMRIGELFALEWSDINFGKEIIHVTKSQTIKKIVKKPKTKAGTRDVEMTPKAKEALMEQFKITGADPDQRVFKSPTGKIWSKPDMFRRYWAQILALAKIKYRNPYQMRHTFISHMLTLGNSPMNLYRMVGHENAEMIYKNYARFIYIGNGVKLLKTE